MAAAGDSHSARKSRIPVVFISSTVEDLKPYRAAAHDAAIRARFHPEMQEYFGPAGRPALEECFQRVEQAEVLVVIVAHRRGWVPDGQEKSITWLECERALRERKQVLAFLVDKGCAWPDEYRDDYRLTMALREGKLTPDLIAEVQQDVAGLAEFKRWLESGLVCETFTSSEDLRGKVESALRAWRDCHPEFAPVAAPPAPADPRRYLEDLRELTGWIDIRGLQVGAGKAYRFPIGDLYIPLTTAAPAEETRGKHPCRETELAREPVPLERALGETRLVIVGDPGSGKTTFLRRVASALCHAGLTEDPAQAGIDLGLEGRPFPLLIRIPELAEHIRVCRQRPDRPGPAAAESPAWLAHFLATQNAERNWGLGPEFLGRRLEEQPTLLLLDGLDEPGHAAERQSMARLFENATRAYPRCRFVVTTRPLAYEGETVLAGFRQARIEPLEPAAIDRFLEHWCAALFPESPPQARRHLAELSEALRARAEIRLMARNPVMLTALAVVHWNERRLPEQRADLYDSILTWLARSRKREEGREAADRCLLLFQHLALAMQAHPGGRHVGISRGAAAALLAPLFSESSEEARLRQADGFLTREEVDSGIITSRASELRFWHLTFQEYLAARAIAGKPDAEQHALLLAGGRIYLAEWRETALLLAGVLGVKQGPPKVDALVSALLDALGDCPTLAAQARCAGLLGAVLRDLRPLAYQPADPRCQATLDAILGVFDAGKAQSLDFRLRLEAAEALGQAGDPRLGKEKPENWITIPGGRFLMGAQKDDLSQPNYDPQAYDDEAPVHEVELDAYQIARYPVTVAEFQQFIEAEGYQNPKWWTAGGLGEAAEPAGWDSQTLHPNRPVTGVSWYEAAAYCAWASCRLPTEAEWERAARGSSGRRYPWGNEKPDTSRAQYGGWPAHPTPVGLYPAGAAPEGTQDIAGNVWEWVADWYTEKYYQESPRGAPHGPASGAGRVLRGGSWGSSPRDVRASGRNRCGPEFRNVNIGFRCARDIASP